MPDSVSGRLALIAQPVLLVNAGQIVKIEFLAVRAGDLVLKLAQNDLV